MLNGKRSPHGTCMTTRLSCDLCMIDSSNLKEGFSTCLKYELNEAAALVAFYDIHLRHTMALKYAYKTDQVKW